VFAEIKIASSGFVSPFGRVYFLLSVCDCGVGVKFFVRFCDWYDSLIAQKRVNKIPGSLGIQGVEDGALKRKLRVTEDKSDNLSPAG
jgi:hypothetical protein